MEKYCSVLFYILVFGIVSYDKLDLGYTLLPCFGSNDIMLVFNIQEIEAMKIAKLLEKYVERK